MIDFSVIGNAFLVSFQYVGYNIIGVIFGLFLGALPGFSSSNGLVVVLPIILSMEPTSALVFMAATYVGAEMGGSYPAILVNVPGGPGAVVTGLDGYEMAKKGMAQQAIAISATASALGGCLTTVLVLFTMPFLAKVALKFGTIQCFVIIIFGVAVLGKLGGKDLTKGLLVGALGLLLGATGSDPIYSSKRATFGFIQLYDGMPPIAALVGFFGISECLMMLEHETIVDAGAIGKVLREGLKASWEGVRITVKCWATLIRGSIIGLIIGIIPGTGGAVSAILSYQQEVQANPGLKWGKGEPRGVLGPEAANNAVVAGAIVPTFTLGIPGSGTMVVILVVMESLGLLIGPQFMEKNAGIAYTVIASMLFGNLIIFLTAFFGAKYISKLTIVPTRIMIPSIIVLSLFGAFAPRSYVFDIYVALIFGILGYIMKNYGYPITPLILGIVLGPYAEEFFLRGMRLGSGNILIFFKDPVSLALWVILILTFAGSKIYRGIRGK